MDPLVKVFPDARPDAAGEASAEVARGEHASLQFVVTIHQVNEGKVVAASVDPAGPDADAFYAQFFPALVAHLKQRGWLGTYLQHLADEPIAQRLVQEHILAFDCYGTDVTQFRATRRERLRSLSGR